MEKRSRGILGSRSLIRLATLAVIGLLITPALIAAEESSPGNLGMMVKGRVTYRIYCTSCHGATGRGDGNLAQYMNVQPANLTQLTASTDDGVFPAARLHDVIDGRKPDVRGHGATEMPVWGDVFQTLGDQGTDEEHVNLKISELVIFLESIQETPSGAE